MCDFEYADSAAHENALRSKLLIAYGAQCFPKRVRVGAAAPPGNIGVRNTKPYLHTTRVALCEG